MRTNLAGYAKYQVFLNYPFDATFEPLALAMHFGVVAGGLLPVCAMDLSTPDKLRLEMLAEAIGKCDYSAHDFSRFTGEGEKNWARFNMPLELGMAISRALMIGEGHHFAFFVSTPYDYRAFASDLSGLDPKCHNNDEGLMVAGIYEWLRSVVPQMLFNSQPTAHVQEKYDHFRRRLCLLEGSGTGGKPSHDEAQELMYQICSECGWWDWRANKSGKAEFPVLPLSWRDDP